MSSRYSEMVRVEAWGNEVRETRCWVMQGFGKERVFCSDQRPNITQ